MTNRTRNRKKINFAIDAAPAAIPPNPNIAATIATIKNITVQRNIIYSFSPASVEEKAMPSVSDRARFSIIKAAILAIERHTMGN